MSAEFPVLVRDLFGEVCGCEERRAENVEPKAKAADRSVRAPKVYRDLDELECLATKVVGGLSYSAACFDKRFAREIRGVTKATMAQEGTGLTFLTGLTGGVGQAVPLAVIVGPPRDSMQAACERCPELRDVEVLR